MMGLLFQRFLGRRLISGKVLSGMVLVSLCSICGILFALVACGIAVATYNEGASDFKETPAYEESVQTQGLLEEPDTSNPDVFKSNPTEVAPSLE